MIELASWDKRDIVNLLDFIGLVGYFTALVIGISLQLNFLMIVNIGASCMITCFLSTTFLCRLWKIPRSSD